MLKLYAIFSTVTGFLSGNELYGKEYAERLADFYNFRDGFPGKFVTVEVTLTGELAEAWAYLADYCPDC